MKTVLRGTVGAIVLAICISLAFSPQKVMATPLPVSKNSNVAYGYAV
jgi:hypothetical protein